jgi:hypothetical protein
MRKTFQLAVEGKNRDRVVDAVKHEIRKYVKRERRRELPAGVDFLDFDCRFGLAADSAQAVHLNGLIPAIDAAVQEGAASCYVEILAKPGHRKAKPAVAAPDPGAAANAQP